MGKGNFMMTGVRALALLTCLSLAGCSTISDWFTDDEELEVRRLKPIESQFTANQLWTHDFGSGVNHYYSRLRPAVGYGLVFAANRQGKVAAFEPESGKVVWQQNFATSSNDGYLSGISNLWSDGISAKIAGGLTVAYESVYLGTENGDVMALNAKSGEVVWRTTIRGEILAAPAVDEGVVLINTGAGVMFALDAQSGEQLWSYESEVPALSLRGISAPTAVNGGAIVGTATGKLAVNILGTGQTAWEQIIAAPSGATELDRIVDIDSRPLVIGGVIYVISYDGTLASVELRSGRVIWKREYKSYRRVTTSGNKLFVVDNNSNTFALDRRNGIELWSQRSLKGRVLTAGEPIGDYVVFGDNYGYLHWINQEDGKIVSRMDLGGDDEDEAIYSSPVASGDMLYTQTREGQVFAIKMP